MVSTKLRIKPLSGSLPDTKQLQLIQKQLQQWRNQKATAHVPVKPLFKQSELLEELHVPSLSELKAKSKGHAHDEHA